MPSQYAKPDVLVGTEWVSQHAKDHDVRLVEVDVDTTAYEQGHIEGAVGWNWQTQLQDQLRRDVPGKQDLENLLAESGISNDTTIVVYGDNHNWFATYAFWLLKYYGHGDVRILDGGRAKWIAEGRPVTKKVPRYPRARYTARDPDHQIRAFRDDVLKGVSGDKVALVDVRSPREFSGELLAPDNLPQEGSQRGGHIPSASNIVWSNAVREDSTFKSPDELRALYGGQGITPDREVIAYCRIGERSSHTWFVLKVLLGYPKVRNYDGSWTEWGSSIGVPIEKP